MATIGPAGLSDAYKENAHFACCSVMSFLSVLITFLRQERALVLYSKCKYVVSIVTEGKQSWGKCSEEVNIHKLPSWRHI